VLTVAFIRLVDNWRLVTLDFCLPMGVAGGADLTVRTLLASAGEIVAQTRRNIARCLSTAVCNIVCMGRQGWPLELH
jgi:hypothetical protein